MTVDDLLGQRIGEDHDTRTQAQGRRGLKAQFLPNVIANGGIFLLSILLGMWFTPYLIQHLGVAAYGIVPLANSLTPYLGLLSLSLNGAAGRYLTLDLRTERFDSANRTFNTVLFGNIGLIVLTLPLVVGLTVAAPHWFDIPTGQEVYARWFFASTLGSYLLTLLQSSFSVSSWAQNRFDLRNTVVAAHHLVRVGIVVALFSLTRPVLSHVGIGILGAALFALMGDVWLWRSLTPQLRIRPSSFDRSRVQQLFGMGGWMVVNQVGTLLWRSDLIVANTLLGADIAGRYGSVLLFSTMLSQLAETVSTVLTPSIIAKYARGEMQAMNQLAQQSVKFLGLALALPIGLICGLARPLLRLWLGPEFEVLAGLLVVLIAHKSANITTRPLYGLNLAFGRVKLPGIVTLLTGMVNVLLAVAFIQLGWGIIGIALAGAITMSLKNSLFMPVYTAAIQGIPMLTFFKPIPLCVVSALVVGGVAYVASEFVLIHSWLTLAGVCGGICVMYAAVVYFGVLSKEDRTSLVGLLPYGHNN